MKRITFTLLGILLAATFAVAQVTPLPLVVKDARSIAMGGAFNALSSGYQSLYGNPAGFALGRGMLTLANVTTWGFIRPTTDEMAQLESIAATGATPSDYLNAANQLITGNGLGAGAAAGIGWTGAGLGLGVTAVTEEYAHGLTLLGTQFQSVTQINVIAGMAITLGPKDFNLKVGGDLRPFARIDSTFPATDLITALATGGDPSAVINNADARFGLGLAADLGAIFTMGSLSAGLSIRDIAPSFAFGQTTLGDILSTGGSPSYTTSDQGQFLPNVAFGLGYSPRFIPGIIDPSLYFEVQDPIRALQENDSVWNLLHVGGELRLLSFVYLRGGINQGWLTAGLGVNLLILEIDGAIFTEELGHHPGDFPRSGVAANIRLHL
jgi:hypothetical protein